MTSKFEFLSLPRPPAKLNMEEAAWHLGFSPHEIPILISQRLLRPLGHPPPNGGKYFSTAALDRLRQDDAWLAKACDALVSHWKNKNEKARGMAPSRGCGRINPSPSSKVSGRSAGRRRAAPVPLELPR